MSFAVFSSDVTLARMLQLEAKRCGFFEESPEKARVWLVDLDHPLSRNQQGTPLVQIGFSSNPDDVKEQERRALYALLTLPLSVRDLAQVLSRDLPVADGVSLSEGKKPQLSKVEQKLLTLLCENRHRTVSTRELADAIGESAENSNAIAVYFYRLRRKLEADGRRRIQTVRGKGYRWMGE